MAQYSRAFKTRVLQRLVGPQAVSANRLAADLGVPQETPPDGCAPRVV